MRTIFKAWIKSEKIMLEVAAISFMEEKVWDEKMADIYDPDCRYSNRIIAYDFKEIELLQFTGLLDRNGKEIFEGNIVKHNLGIGIVEFENGCFTFTGQCPFKLIGPTIVDPEVIGNIYENPELLGG